MKPHSKVEEEIVLTSEMQGTSSSYVSNKQTIPDLVVVDRPLEFFDFPASTTSRTSTVATQRRTMGPLEASGERME
jgi:hypothetical protein